MSEYVLSCCSTADLSKEHFNRRDIRYVCFHCTLGGTEYPDDLGESLPPAELYRRMVAGEEARTSQVSAGDYEAFFEESLKAGKDILHVTLSTGISGTYNSACVAKDELLERYPERKIYIVDSLGASSGYGLIMETLADRRDEGMSIDELYHWTEENKLNLHHWFFSTDLTFYIRGGRISKTAGFIGSVMGICPLLNMDNEGRLIPREKVRTKRKVISRIVEKMEQHAQGGLDYSGKCYLSHSECLEDAKAVAALVEDRFQKLDGKVEIFPIGATIGSHTGPGTIALFFWGDERKS
ncbi:MAG: DegV family protein [Lachnospiraceae bacterium]|nr:DegV family protein [Lachnospiraceae bacterium]MCM1240641.1 DegV family protein [Lachnospiraceae bacterium]MCM1303995.1 DegV family protein [Butyrivibrio sp.]MCM1344741.1 DegV family protein [Muribaculaceae bacterium]MCM1409103.1 DegV family protein [Lachnospiraceae bacterium]